MRTKGQKIALQSNALPGRFVVRLRSGSYGALHNIRALGDDLHTTVLVRSLCMGIRLQG